MVYRGRPSPGCNACRKAKKSCDLQQPACSRCVSLKKECSGYRDTTQLQIHDESEAVILKANRTKRKAKLRASPASPPTIGSFRIPSAIEAHIEATASSGEEVYWPEHRSNYEPVSISRHDRIKPGLAPRKHDDRLLMNIKLKADDVSTVYFFRQFTSEGHWNFLQKQAMQSKLDPCINYAMKACGMAALENVSRVPTHTTYTRTMYVEALRLLNTALRDPQDSKTDSTLLAVVMLGYFENLTCDSRASIQSWRAHIKGASQLLKLRGKAQFQTAIGCAMFREVRSHILISAIWEDEEPPEFLAEWENDLREASPDGRYMAASGDHPLMFMNRFAHLRSRLKRSTVSDEDALHEADELEARMVHWSVQSRENTVWRCDKLEVPNSPHIWNNTVTSYQTFAAPSAWQGYYSLRIMNTRLQEFLARRLNLSEQEIEERVHYKRRVCRQMTDDICCSVPVSLGHAAPAMNSPCILISAYTAIWPLFFAGSCTLERVGTARWEEEHRPASSSDNTPPSSVASAQVAWIIGRMDHISQIIGLKWATGIAAVLKGDFRLHQNLRKDDTESTTWLQEIKNAHRGPRMLIEKEPRPSGALKTGHSGPIWVGRYTGENVTCDDGSLEWPAAPRAPPGSVRT